MRRTGLLLLACLGIVLAGCSAPAAVAPAAAPASATGAAPNDGVAAPPSAPQTGATVCSLPQSQTVTVPAGATCVRRFNSQAGLSVNYTWRSQSGAAVDLGFVAQANVSAYADHQAVAVTAGHEGAWQTTDGARLAAGAWAFAVRCPAGDDCVGSYLLVAR